ncbi:MAG: hypothetical protein ABI873_12380 [Marmoricola sp.]
MAKSEKDSQAEGVHRVPGEVPPGESRGEQLRDVEGMDDGGDVDGDTNATTSSADSGPTPTEVGSGGAQRVFGARISDRLSAGEDLPEGPPFGDEPAGEPRDDVD